MNTLLHPPVSRAGSALPPAAERLLRRLRSGWRRATLMHGGVVTAAIGISISLLLVLIDLVYPLSAAARAGLRFLPLLAALGFLCWTVYRVVRAPDARRLALLAEERLPLGNRLVTALELKGESALAAAFRADAERSLAGIDPRSAVPFRAGIPAVVLAAGVVLLVGSAVLFPMAAAEAWNRWLAPADSYESAWQEIRADAIPALPPPPPAGFSELRWRIVPPAYAGLPAREERGSELLSVLPGSRIEVRSRLPGSWSAVRAVLVGGGELPVQIDGGEWQAEWTFGAAGRGVSFQAVAEGGEAARRVVAIVPATDHPPEVELSEPEADLVVATPSGRLPIRASARDDYGIGEFILTWIRSRGSGESFSFAEGEWEWDQAGREGRTVRGEYTLDLAVADLQPGDVLHIRAVARDRNTVTGPGEGVSATRVVRIALPDEMHTVTTIIGYPIEAERTPLLSQRMLILMTEELRDRVPRLDRQEVLHEAGEIADEQGRLRARVGEQVYTRSVGGLQDPTAEIGFEEIVGLDEHDHETGEGGDAGEGDEQGAADPAEVLEDASRATGTGSLEELAHQHDEAPIIDVNRRRITAYNAMWEAERALRQGEPAAALLHQYEALRLLQEEREADRVYARGRSRVPTIDVAGLRGSGEIDDAAPAPRSPAPPLAAAPPWIPELERTAERLGERPGTELAAGLASLAARMLADPRVDPRAAAMVSRAADAAGRDAHGEARELLARIRTLVAPRVEAGSAPPLPTPADPVAAEYFRRLGEGRR